MRQVISQNATRPFVSRKRTPEEPYLAQATNIKWFSFVFLALIFSPSAPVHAGPPFVTDDPEPVEFHGWEFYIASEPERTKEGWSGTLPHMEFNYGAFRNVELHLETPVYFSAPRGGGLSIGYGDTEVGFKYRFIQETDKSPQLAIYPLLEIPSGNGSRGVGTKNLNLFLPIWARKSFGNWTIDAGGGYWINPGTDNLNWGFFGAVAQRKITKKLSLGAEIYHERPQTVDGTSNTIVNGGAIIETSEHTHFVFSVGHSIQGASALVAYIGVQIEFGPDQNETTETH